MKITTKENGKDFLDLILQECEMAAANAKLTEKETMRLRLIGEELVGMLPELLSFTNGEFWIEPYGKKIELHLSLVPNENLDFEKREKILAISSDGKNASASGVMSKIKIAIEFMLIDYENTVKVAAPFFDYGFTSDTVPASPMWTLINYRDNVNKEKDEKWDELEKSIIANIADDVTVGLQGNKVEITVKKSF
ncbi:hypothetical protein MSI_14460 [Treponema sp. JC4]|uniref:hypothetical protein n=1 Tax=Treponema sp. JC4 TaxID=1124982 RepID=UPI00025B02E2|nr:hypothetical protein [Treponema sp. JC4]EID85060.1 hypothetical protein MSI_14460 [Treponema sp. JC4]